ncbi:MAG: phosphatidylserine decarboxylase [Gammaproteobacteria bacterium]|nr:phosphatidylserine decarboxylase [Gammaproteobacteria bacterium]
MLDRLFALLLMVLPHHLLSYMMYKLTRSEWPLLKNWLIRTLVRMYNIDVEEAISPFPEDYESFNAFFTRSLQPDARRIAADETTIACPVDGAVSQAGSINQGRIFQAKGQYYSLVELLGGGREWVNVFDGGSFTTLYLSPRDYHRVHMPLTGRLTKMIHVPGRLFSVSPSTARSVPKLYSRNERIVCLFDTEAGPMAVILVGAIFVASMETVWAGLITPSSRRVSQWTYSDQTRQSVELKKGEELGRFNMGSTVILLFGKGALAWEPMLKAGAEVRMGEAIGRMSRPGAEPATQPD